MKLPKLAKVLTPKVLTLLGIVFNLIDGILSTIFMVFNSEGEINPLMRYALDTHLSLFIFLKLTVTTVFFFILFKFRDQRPAKIGLNIIVIVYSLLMLWWGWTIYLVLAPC